MATTKTRPWREVVKVHPAADVFPLMGPDELTELANDIKENGLQNSVLVSRKGREVYVIDGRNRLDALERAGLQVVCDDGQLNKLYVRSVKMPEKSVASLVIALNIKRRHLTPAQRAKMAAAAVVADDKFQENFAKATAKPRPDVPAPSAGKSAVGRDEKGRMLPGSESPNKSEVAVVAELADVGRDTARKAVEAERAKQGKPSRAKGSTKPPAKKATGKKTAGPSARTVMFADFLSLLKRTKGASLTEVEIKALHPLADELARVTAEAKAEADRLATEAAEAAKIGELAAV